MAKGQRRVYSRREYIFILIALAVTLTALLFIGYWAPILNFLASKYPGSSPAAYDLGFLFILATVLAAAWVVGLVLSSQVRLNGAIFRLFQAGSTPAVQGIVGYVGFVVGSFLVTGMAMTFVYAVPSLPGAQSLPSVFGLSTNLAQLVESLATPGQPYALPIQVGLMISGPAFMFWARMGLALTGNERPRVRLPQALSYLTWLMVAVLILSYLSGGAQVQGISVFEAIIAGLFTSFLSMFAFFPLERLVVRLSRRSASPA